MGMTREEVNEYADATEVPLILLEGDEFDEAIIGIVTGMGASTAVAYDADKCVEVIARNMEGDKEARYESAREYFEFNTAGAFMGEGTPMFVQMGEAQAVTPLREAPPVLTEDILDLIIAGVTDNWPEYVLEISCTGWDYALREFRFTDTEDDTKYVVDCENLRLSLTTMLLDIRNKKLFLPYPPITEDEDVLDDWFCSIDAEWGDALAQYACFGDIVYG